MTILIDSNSFPNAWGKIVQNVMDHGHNRPADDIRAVMIRNTEMVIDLDHEAISDIYHHRLHPLYPQQHGLEDYVAQYDPGTIQAKESMMDQPYTYMGRTLRQLQVMRSQHMLKREFNKRNEFITWNPFEDLGSVAPPCFDDETEILTYDGWIKMKNVSFYTNVATLNPDTNYVEYHTPYNVIHKLYNGKMCTQQNRTINYMVTPNHMMYVAKQDSHIFEFVKAEDLLYKMHIKSSAKSIGDTNVITIGDKTHDLKTFAKFLAIYLADGSYLQNGLKYHYRINITQKYNKEEYIKIINELGYNYYISNDYNSKECIHISISNKALYEYVSQFGKSSEKYIPDIIKHAGSEIICEFLAAYRLGDYNTTTGSGRYGTTSQRLANDLQELIILSGLNYRASIYSRKDVKYYEVIEREYIYGAEVNKPEYINYDGMIHCVEVPNNIIMVRRNGKPMWCGNCFQNCNLVNIGGDRVHMITHWRSHDMYGAWMWNIIGIVEYVTKQILEPEGLRLVKYTEFNNSAHVYDYNWMDAKRVRPLAEVALHMMY